MILDNRTLRVFIHLIFYQFHDLETRDEFPILRIEDFLKRERPNLISDSIKKHLSKRINHKFSFQVDKTFKFPKKKEAKEATDNQNVTQNENLNQIDLEKEDQQDYKSEDQQIYQEKQSLIQIFKIFNLKTILETVPDKQLTFRGTYLSSYEKMNFPKKVFNFWKEVEHLVQDPLFQPRQIYQKIVEKNTLRF
ncbi:hypothetical protein M0811_05457 [Anaeramoeba ignava]|uniref:Uncharacterized protein n=1 Tax=Anaeramoeba ignava TaxID=1746090 RepID=A0A9Q0LRP9_ANAIG|nr:hypothetical protein M0811_05457 [Anaeramoeba ignava]